MDLGAPFNASRCPLLHLPLRPVNPECITDPLLERDGAGAQPLRPTGANRRL